MSGLAIVMSLTNRSKSSKKLQFRRDILALRMNSLIASANSGFWSRFNSACDENESPQEKLSLHEMSGPGGD